MTTVRACDPATDTAQVEAIDTSFETFTDDEPWDAAYVAEGGFSAVSYAAWNRRLVIQQFYVDCAYRRRGIDRRLMDHAVAWAARAGAETAWAETSNRNAPGVEAYHRLGFVLCGFDLTLYTGTAARDEFALYLTRDV